MGVQALLLRCAEGNVVMSAFAEFLVVAPMPAVTAAVALRYGPQALVTLIAGVVATLTGDARRGDRALAVLRLFHGRYVRMCRESRHPVSPEVSNPGRNR